MKAAHLTAAAIAALGLETWVAGTPADSEGRRATLVFSGNLNGVLAPCGCQQAQGGGLARWASALRDLAPRTSDVLLMDGGNLVSRLSPSPEALREAR